MPRALLQGQGEEQSGEELLSLLVRPSTARILQEAVEQEQAVAFGRRRHEGRGEKPGERNGDEHGTLRTGTGGSRPSAADSRTRGTVAVVINGEHRHYQ